MVLRKRPPKEEQENQDNKPVDQDEQVHDTKIKDTETRAGFITPTPDKIKTFREQACMVLDLLEEQGIDIYDPSRYPGMYLHGNTAPAPDLKKRVTIAVHKTSKPVTDPEPSKPSPDVKSSVRSFFKNKNNE